MLALFVFVVISFIPAIVGGLFVPGQWYAQLAKPSWTPPGYVFGPVWTALYATMAVAGWLVWRARDVSSVQGALVVFALQLALNGLWSGIFFGMHRPGLAFANITVLWVSILATLILFWQIRPLAGVLFVPYFLWVSFASALNYAIWQLNV
jgi:tryptophan-rich sensory protein